MLVVLVRAGTRSRSAPDGEPTGDRTADEHLAEFL